MRCRYLTQCLPQLYPNDEHCVCFATRVVAMFYTLVIGLKRCIYCKYNAVRDFFLWLENHELSYE